MKKRFRPYLNKFFGMTLLWVILLILLIWAEPIQIIVVYRRWNYKLLAAIAAVIYALRYAVRHFIPGVLAILDSGVQQLPNGKDGVCVRTHRGQRLFLPVIGI